MPSPHYPALVFKDLESDYFAVLVYLPLSAAGATVQRCLDALACGASRELQREMQAGAPPPEPTPAGDIPFEELLGARSL